MTREVPVTEETLAAQLGIQPTLAMNLIRALIMGLAPSQGGDMPAELQAALADYRRLGEEMADLKRDEARPQAQIALILLMAALYRDIAKINPAYGEYYQEELGDAQLYADNLDLSADVTAALAALIAAA